MVVIVVVVVVEVMVRSNPTNTPSIGMSRLQMRGKSLVYLCSVMLVLYLTVKYSMFSTLLTISAGW